ncbi:hypothetical protein GCM10009588_31970 [Microbacterium phyllosphaerae]
MAYWKEPEGPQEASDGRIRARERFRILQECEDGLRALPVSEHRAFLKALYAKYPPYPGGSTCACLRCAGGTR